jgi:hypothetical protein
MAAKRIVFIRLATPDFLNKSLFCFSHNSSTVSAIAWMKYNVIQGSMPRIASGLHNGQRLGGEKGVIDNKHTAALRCSA